jgi:acetone carboxylase gamma subunit
VFFYAHLLINKDVSTKNKPSARSSYGLFSWARAWRLETYIYVKGTLYTCTKLYPQRHRTDDVETVAVSALCFLRTFTYELGPNNDKMAAREEFPKTFHLG